MSRVLALHGGIASLPCRRAPLSPRLEEREEISRTIYRSLFIQTCGVLKKQLMVHLRTARQMHQARGGTRKSGLEQIIDTVSIRKRPRAAEDRAVPGHWEGDLFSGSSATIREGHTTVLVVTSLSRPPAA